MHEPKAITEAIKRLENFKIQDKTVFSANYNNFKSWYADAKTNCRFDDLNITIPSQINLILTHRPDFVSQIEPYDENFVAYCYYAISKDSSIFNLLSTKQKLALLAGKDDNSTLDNILALLKHRPGLIDNSEFIKFFREKHMFISQNALNNYMPESFQDRYWLQQLFPDEEKKQYQEELKNVLDDLSVESVTFKDFQDNDRAQINHKVLAAVYKDIKENSAAIIEKIGTGKTAAVSRLGKQEHKKDDEDIRIKGKHTPYSYMITPEGKLIITPKRKKANMEDNEKMEHRKFEGAFKKVELAYEIDLTQAKHEVVPKAIAWPNIDFDDIEEPKDIKYAVARIESVQNEYSRNNVSEVVRVNMRPNEDKLGSDFGTFFLMDRLPLDLSEADISSSTDEQLRFCLLQLVERQVAGVPVLDAKSENVSAPGVDGSTTEFFDINYDTTIAEDGSIIVNHVVFTPDASLPACVAFKPAEDDNRRLVGALSLSVFQNKINTTEGRNEIVNFSTFAALDILAEIYLKRKNDAVNKVFKGYRDDVEESARSQSVLTLQNIIENKYPSLKDFVEYPHAGVDPVPTIAKFLHNLPEGHRNFSMCADLITQSQSENFLAAYMCALSLSQNCSKYKDYRKRSVNTPVKILDLSEYIRDLRQTDKRQRHIAKINIQLKLETVGSNNEKIFCSDVSKLLKGLAQNIVGQSYSYSDKSKEIIGILKSLSDKNLILGSNNELAEIKRNIKSALPYSAENNPTSPRLGR